MQTGARRSKAIHKRIPTLTLLGLALLVIVPVGLLVTLRGFDGLYGQDAYAYYAYATGPLRASLRMLQAPPPFFWPPGYPLLFALFSFVLGPVPLAGQLVSLLAGALVPVLTALLARELWLEGRDSWPVPALAGLLTAFAGQLWQSSAVVMSDTVGLAAATLGMWAAARYGRTDEGHLAQDLGWLILAAGALGFAVLTRWAMALVAIPAGAYALVVLARRPRTTAVQHAAVAGLLAILVLTPVLGSTWHGLFSSGGDAPGFAGDVAVVSWHPLNALRRAFQNIDGFRQYLLPNAVYYGLAPARRFFFTPLLAAFLLPGLWAVLRRRGAAPALLLLGWAGVVYLFLAGIPWQNFRFTLTALPPLAILAAIGVQTTAQLLGGAGRRLLVLLLAVGLLGMAYSGWSLTQGFIVRKNANLATARWTQEQIPAGAQLLTFGLTLTFRHYTPLEVEDLFALTPTDLEGLARAGTPLYLLLDLDNINDQWRGQAPEINYRWLERNSRLVPVGVRPPYSLLRVQPVPPAEGTAG